MTTITAPAPAATGRRRDTRTARRVAAAVLLPLGPLAVALIRGLIPYYTVDTPDQMISHAASALGQLDVVLWLSVLGMLTLIPSTLAAARLAQRRAPVLSLLALVLLVPAFGTLFASSGDATLRLLAAGADHDTAARLWTEWSALGPVLLGLMIFVVAHIVGYIVLGAALWRARVVPAWAAVALMASQPLHFVFAVIAPNHLLDACSWGLAALGLAAAAVTVLRTANDEWDLPPARLTSTNA